LFRHLKKVIKTTFNNQKKAQKLKKETNNKQKTYVANTFERAKMDVLYLKVSIAYHFQFKFCRKMQEEMLLKTKKIGVDPLLLHQNMVQKPKVNIILIVTVETENGRGKNDFWGGGKLKIL
jgi:hypothetical protein